MDYYPASLPLPPVPGYMCQPSPTQTAAAVPPNIAYPTIVPTHDITMMKQPPCTLISNAYAAAAAAAAAGGPMTVLHLPGNLLQTLQRAPFQYDPTKDLVATCSQCGQKNTLWELRMKELINCLKEEYALKCFLRKEIRFEPYPGEELQISVANNMGGYTQTDLCKISNLRANANEFTPALRNPKVEVPNRNKYEHSTTEECDLQQQQKGRLGGVDSGLESSSHQDSGVSDSGNHDSTTIDSISEPCIQNNNVASAHGSTESLLKRSNDVDDSTNTTDFHTSKPKMMDNNRNYKHNDESSIGRKEKTTNDRYNIQTDSDSLQQMNKMPSRSHSRSSEYKKGSTNGNEPRRHNGYAEDKRLPSRLSQGHVHPKTKSLYDRSRRPVAGGAAPAEYNDHGNDIHAAREPKYPYRHSSNGSHIKKLNRKVNEASFIHEIEGDLFSAEEDCSLAHCVAEDFRMGAGIALQFKKQFNGVGELLNQQKTVGEVAYLEKPGRFIFYLITKRHSYMKPTQEIMHRALKNLRRLCEELKVKKLAMPMLGCGLERLKWEDVKNLLNEVFCHTDTEIFVYHCKEAGYKNYSFGRSGKRELLSTVRTTYDIKKVAEKDGDGISERRHHDANKRNNKQNFFLEKDRLEDSDWELNEKEETVANVEGSPVSKAKSLKIVEVPYPLVKIEHDTAMVVYGALDGTVEKMNEQLNAKYPYLDEFAKRCQAGTTDDFHAISSKNEYVCVLIVKKNHSDPFSYTRLEQSIRKLNKFLKEDKYQYVGIDRITDNDTLINDKIISVFRSYLITNVNLYVCSSPPKKSEYQSSASKSNSYYNANSTVSSN